MLTLQVFEHTGYHNRRHGWRWAQSQVQGYFAGAKLSNTKLNKVNKTLFWVSGAAE